MRELSELVNRINNTAEDIRAEVLVADLLSSGMRVDDIIIRFSGQMKRPRSSDIAKVQIAQSSMGRDQLEIFLNRDSIYDMLPEGLFHQPSADKNPFSVSAMVEEYHQHRREEEEARQFFAPLENELFLQKAFTASEAFRHLFKIQKPQLDSSVLKKLGIEPGLPPEFTSKLVRALPYLSQITGNISRTEQIFSLLLGDPATIEVDSFSELEASGHFSLLGDTDLGVDLVAGNSIRPDHHLYLLSVGPVSKKKLLLYKEGGWKKEAFQTLVNFVIPIEWDLTVQIEIQKEEAVSFILDDDKKTDARLGYTTTLPQST